MMAARSQVVQVPGYKSGKMHSGSLHRLSVGDDRIFRRKHENISKDTAVCLLIDNSSSMSFRNRIGIAMTASYALAQTLERVGISHEVLGFTTLDPSLDYKHEMEKSKLLHSFARYEPIYIPIYKDFEERITPLVKRRFADVLDDVHILDQNVDGESVEIAAARLMRRREKRKVLLVLSDGEPVCMSRNLRALKDHLRNTIQQISKSGVEIIGIGIESAAVASYYPKSVVLKDLATLPSVVMNELKQILIAA
jgi:cobalamin biosynthesis protein CobT